MSDEPFRIVPADQVPAGLKEAEFVFDPPLEQWPLVEGQEQLWTGDFVKRDAAGRIIRSNFYEGTHVFVGLQDGVAYVQRYPNVPASVEA